MLTTVYFPVANVFTPCWGHRLRFSRGHRSAFGLTFFPEPGRKANSTCSSPSLVRRKHAWTGFYPTPSSISNNSPGSLMSVGRRQCSKGKPCGSLSPVDGGYTVREVLSLQNSSLLPPDAFSLWPANGIVHSNHRPSTLSLIYTHAHISQSPMQTHAGCLVWFASPDNDPSARYQERTAL